MLTYDGMTPVLTVTDHVAARIIAEALHEASRRYRDSGDIAAHIYARDLAESAELQRVALWRAQQTSTMDETATLVAVTTIEVGGTTDEQQRKRDHRSGHHGSCNFPGCPGSL